ncbi:MAG: RNA chaperone Hfq [bacterium]|nr:RNA chaperone Hfq [bacterium]
MESEFVKKKRIGDIFLEMGIITDLQLRTGLERQAVVQKRIGEILVENGLITEDDVAYALAKQFGVQFFDISSLSLDPVLMNEFAKDLIVQEEFLPIRKVDERLYIVIHDPTDLTVLDQIKTATQLNVRYAVGAKKKINTMISQYYSTENSMLDEPTAQPEAPPPVTPSSPPPPPEPVISAEPPPEPVDLPFPFEPEPVVEPQTQPDLTRIDTIIINFIETARAADVEITFHLKGGNSIKGIVTDYDARVILLSIRQKREIVFWDAVAGATYLLPGD